MLNLKNGIIENKINRWIGKIGNNINSKKRVKYIDFSKSSKLHIQNLNAREEICSIEDAAIFHRSPRQ